MGNLACIDIKGYSKKKIVDKGFIEDVDYITFRKSEKRKDSRGATVTNEYQLTVDCAKNVCMMENTEAGRRNLTLALKGEF